MAEAERAETHATVVVRDASDGIAVVDSAAAFADIGGTDSAAAPMGTAVARAERNWQG